MKKNGYEEYIEATCKAVSSVVKGIAFLFEEFGMDQMKALTDPSIDQLKEILQNMKKDVITLENNIGNTDNGERVNDIISLLTIPNIKQGILLADNLLNAICASDLEKCNNALKDLKNSSIDPPTWKD